MVAAGDARAALAFAAAIWRYWLVRRNLAEGRELVERALNLEAPPELESLRADAMLGAGQLAQNNGDIAGAAAYFTDVLAIRRRLGDTVGEARALADLGWLVCTASGATQPPSIRPSRSEMDRNVGREHSFIVWMGE